MVNYPGEDLTFLADSMLKKLAKYLRALGYDTGFKQSAKDKTLLHLAIKQNRVLLTRDRALYGQIPELYGCYLKSQHTETQLRQLVQLYSVAFRESHFLTRCLECNTVVEKISKSSVEKRVPSRVYEYHDEFYYCPVCDQIYWYGGHVKRLRKKLVQILNEN